MEKYRKKFALTDSKSPSGIGLLVVVIGIMWVTEVVDTVLGGRLDTHGIIPRSTAGLDGILWSPFLHGGFSHLISNTLPFAVLSGLVLVQGVRRWICLLYTSPSPRDRG